MATATCKMSMAWTYFKVKVAKVLGTVWSANGHADPEGNQAICINDNKNRHEPTIQPATVGSCLGSSSHAGTQSSDSWSHVLRENTCKHMYIWKHQKLRVSGLHSPLPGYYIYNINYIFIIYNLPYVQYHMCSIPGMIVRSCRPHGLASRCAVWKFLLALRGISPASVLGSDSVS